MGSKHAKPTQTVVDVLIGREKPKKVEPTPESVIHTIQSNIAINEKRIAYKTKLKNHQHHMALEFMKQENKESASVCLRKEKMLDSELKQLYNFKVVLENQLMSIEQAMTQREIMDTMRGATSGIRNITNEHTQEDAETLMEEMRESIETVNEIGNILSSGIAPEIDVSQELEAMQVSTSRVVVPPPFIPLPQVPDTIAEMERQLVEA